MSAGFLLSVGSCRGRADVRAGRRLGRTWDKQGFQSSERRYVRYPLEGAAELPRFKASVELGGARSGAESPDGVRKHRPPAPGPYGSSRDFMPSALGVGDQESAVPPWFESTEFVSTAPVAMAPC